MGAWSPLNLQFPDLTMGAGVRLLPMQELESYIDDAFEKINQLKILGKFYVVNGAEYTSLDAALNELWAQGINNVEILLRSGVSYTLNNITIPSTRQVFIRGIGGRPNLTVAGGSWYGTIILENVNVTFTGAINSTSGTNTPTIIFRNCSITLSNSVRGERGTVVLKDCTFTATGNHFFHFNGEGYFLCDNVDATPYGFFVSSVASSSGKLYYFLMNSRIKKQAVADTNNLLFCYGFLFAMNCVFDVSQATTSPSTITGIVFAKGVGTEAKNSYAVFVFCDVIGMGSANLYGGGSFQDNGIVTLLRCRFINTNLIGVAQTQSAFTGQVNVIQCYFENNKSFSSFSHEYVIQVSGYYNGLVYGNSVNYTGGTKNNPLFFVRMINPQLCIFAENSAENCSLFDLRDGTTGASDTIVPFVLIANNTSRNCFNKVYWLRPTGHLFVVNNVTYHDMTTSWDNSGSYSWSEGNMDLYGAGLLLHVDTPSGTYTRNKTQDDPLRIVIANNLFLRRLANAIMMHIAGNTSSFAYRVIVEGNVILDCDPERLLSSSQWSTYNTYDNKRKGVGILLNATTTGASEKLEPIIIGNRFINTRYGVYHALGKYGYYNNNKYVFPVIGNLYYRVYGTVSSYINPDSTTDVYWFDNTGMDFTTGTYATVYKTQQQDYSLPSSVPTSEGSYIFPRKKEFDCAGGFAGGYPFGYIPSKTSVFEDITLPNGNKPTYTTVTIATSTTVRAIQLSANMQFWIKVLSRLFSNKTRNYRRLYLDIALYSTSTGSITFNVLRIDPNSGTQTNVVTNYQEVLSGSGINTIKIDVEATRSGFWIYSLQVTNIGAVGSAPPPTVYLIGLWLGIDEYYNYGSDTV